MSRKGNKTQYVGLLPAERTENTFTGRHLGDQTPGPHTQCWDPKYLPYVKCSKYFSEGTLHYSELMQYGRVRM